jgi:hypothetical protein
LLGCAEILRRVDPAIGIGGSSGGGGGDRYPTVANGATILQDAVAAVAEKAAFPRAVVRAVEIFGLPAAKHIDTRKNSTADKKQLHGPETRFILTCYSAYANGAIQHFTVLGVKLRSKKLADIMITTLALHFRKSCSFQINITLSMCTKVE